MKMVKSKTILTPMMMMMKTMMIRRSSKALCDQISVAAASGNVINLHLLLQNFDYLIIIIVIIVIIIIG